SFNTVLGAKQSIAILGKISVPKKEYKEWLLNANQLYEKKTNSADYLIIGEKPGDLDAINGKNIIFESDIWDQSKGKHLDEAPPQVAENLLELMQNPDPDNLNIALLMMEKGGVPREVYEDLIGTMLFHTNNKIRKKSRTIFERHVSLDLPQNAEKQLAKNAYRIKDDKNVTKFLDLLVEGTELDISKIAYAAYRSSDKIQGQGICLQSKEIASFILYDYVDNKWVSLEPQGYLSEGLFLRTLPSFETLAGKVQGIRLDIKGHLKVEEASEFLKLNVFKNIDLNIGFARKIPETVFQNPTVEEMYFVAYRAKKLPKTIGELKNVKKLRMFVSYATAIPKEIGHLKQLEELSISSFAGKTLPVEIFELPALKELYVSGDQISTEYNLELKNICKAKGVIFRSK
ncbi:MAG: hypothetical protein MRY83_15945, partial [Flavobacteriales bacterium]|nr:hypothetical protein [Flavobacteriales bacterium]